MLSEQEIKQKIEKILGEKKYELIDHLLSRILQGGDTLLSVYPVIRPGERYEFNLITNQRFIKIGIEHDIYWYKAVYVNRFTWMTERYIAQEEKMQNWEEFKKEGYPAIMAVEIFFDIQNEDFARQFFEAETKEQQLMLKEFMGTFNEIAFKTGAKAASV